MSLLFTLNIRGSRDAFNEISLAETAEIDGMYGWTDEVAEQCSGFAERYRQR
jgi:hypothetical protein